LREDPNCDELVNTIGKATEEMGVLKASIAEGESFSMKRQKE